MVAMAAALRWKATARIRGHKSYTGTSNPTMVHTVVLDLMPASHASPVFLDTSNTVKLGDFGLSKALAQASFANTYVGVRSSLSLLAPNLIQCGLSCFTDAVLYV